MPSIQCVPSNRDNTMGWKLHSRMASWELLTWINSIQNGTPTCKSSFRIQLEFVYICIRWISTNKWHIIQLVFLHRIIFGGNFQILLNYSWRHKTTIFPEHWYHHGKPPCPRSIHCTINPPQCGYHCLPQNVNGWCLRILLWLLSIIQHESYLVDGVGSAWIPVEITVGILNPSPDSKPAALWCLMP